jgi:hypothetical protein
LHDLRAFWGHVYGTATIIGGAVVDLSLNSAEFTIAQSAFGSFDAGYPDGIVLPTTSNPAVSGDFNVYNLPASTTGTVKLPSSGQAIALTGTNDVKLLGILVAAVGFDCYDDRGPRYSPPGSGWRPSLLTTTLCHAIWVGVFLPMRLQLR